MVGNWYKGVYVDKETYFNAINKIAGLHHQVAIYCKVYPIDLRWHHFKQYAEDVLNFEIVYRDFGRVSSNIVSGMLYSNCGTIAIGINTNMKINEGRQHFTMLHEISHGIAHVNKNLQTQSFKDLISNSSYSPEDIIIENEADFCASIMIIPDEALVDSLRFFASFNDFCNIFEASYACVNTRLFNYLIYNHNLPSSIVRRIVNKYRYENIPLINILKNNHNIDLNNMKYNFDFDFYRENYFFNEK